MSDNFDTEEDAFPNACFWDPEYFKFARHVRNQQRYIWNQETLDFLNGAKAALVHCESIIKKGTVFYRAQHGIDGEDDGGRAIPLGKTRMIPSAEYVGDGRANSRGIPALYLADRLDTAISEMRPWSKACISIAQFETKVDLRVIDLRVNESAKVTAIWISLDGKQPDAAAKARAFQQWISFAFSTPVTRSDNALEYVPTQIIADMLKNEGYAGVVFHSQFGGGNVVLFNPEDAFPINCTPYEVTKVKIEYESIGPTHKYKQES